MVKDFADVDLFLAAENLGSNGQDTQKQRAKIVLEDAPRMDQGHAVEERRQIGRQFRNAGAKSFEIVEFIGTDLPNLGFVGNPSRVIGKRPKVVLVGVPDVPIAPGLTTND